MPVGESQAQLWIELAQWGLPERDSEKPASTVLGGRWRPWQRELHPAVTTAFSEPAAWDKIQACVQKCVESVHGYHNRVQIFKEDSSLPTEAKSTRVAFNSVLMDEHGAFPPSGKKQDGTGDRVHPRSVQFAKLALLHLR